MFWAARIITGSTKKSKTWQQGGQLLSSPKKRSSVKSPESCMAELAKLVDDLLELVAAIFVAAKQAKARATSR